MRDIHAPDRHDFGGNALRLAVAQCNDDGGISGRRIELVERITGPIPFGTSEHVDATTMLWRELAEDTDILGILGPSTTPCVLAVHDEVERIEVPQIHWAGTNNACGEWHFQFQAGFFPDEGPALAYLLTRLGHRKVVCFCGEGDYGAAYIDPFVRSAMGQGIEILGRYPLAHSGTNMADAVNEASRAGADAVVAMGLLGVADQLIGAMQAVDWSPPCFGNCGFALFASNDSAMQEMLDGWTTTDMYDPGNQVLREFFDAYETEYGVRPASATTCFGRDLATLMIEGLKAAPEFSRAGLRAGLEALRGVPSATGGAGSYLAYGPRERLALHGPRLFVFSRITAAGLELVEA